MEQKKTLSARQIASEIKSGATDDELKLKYNLTTKDLQTLFGKLLEAGLVTQAELEQRPTRFDDRFDLDLDDGGPVNQDIPSSEITSNSHPVEDLVESPQIQTDPYIGKMVNKKHMDKAVAEILDRKEVLLGAFWGKPYNEKNNIDTTLRNSYLLTTNKRVIFWVRSLTSEKTESFHYGDISSVEISRHLLQKVIILNMTGGKRLFGSIPQSDILTAVQLIQEKGLGYTGDRREDTKTGASTIDDKIQFIYQIKQGPFPITLYQFTADLKKTLQSDIFYFVSDGKIPTQRINRSAPTSFEFNLNNWYANIDVLSKDDLIVVRAITWKDAKKATSRAWIDVMWSLLGGAIFCPLLYPMACVGLYHAGDTSGKEIGNTLEKALKKLCTKHGMTVLK